MCRRRRPASFARSGRSRATASLRATSSRRSRRRARPPCRRRSVSRRRPLPRPEPVRRATAVRAASTRRSRSAVPDIGDYKDVPVIEVHVQAGATIKVDEPLLTLESDKATMEVPAAQSGTVREVKVKVGDRVSEGTRDRDPRGPRIAAPAGAAADRGQGAGADRQAARRRRRRHPCRGAGARCRSRRLHRGVPGRGSRQEGGAGRALAESRRRLPQRRLHPLEGVAPRRQGHRRKPRHGRPRRHVRGAFDRPRQAARLEGRRRQAAHRRPFRSRQAAQGQRRHGGRPVRRHEPARSALRGRRDEDRVASSRRSSQAAPSR